MLTGIITSRLASTRLPRKALLDLCGKPMLHQIVDRVRKSNVDEVIVATTTKDDEIADYCHKNDIKVYQGSEEDILDRLYCASIGYDHILRVWGDSPMVDPEIINKVIDYYYSNLASGYLYSIWYPAGQNVAMCDFKTLENAHRIVENPYDRLWIHKWFTQQKDTKIFADSYEDLSHLNYTVDTLEDLERMREWYGTHLTTSMGRSFQVLNGSILSADIKSDSTTKDMS